MADTKISAMTAATDPLTGSELVPLVQGGANVQDTVANLTAGRDVGALTLTGTSSVTAGSGGNPTQRLNAVGTNGTGFIGGRFQNSNGNLGLAGVEFSSDFTYAKAAIALTRQAPNGGGYLSVFNRASTDAANWATTDEVARFAQNGSVSLAGAGGTQSLSATPVTSSVNYWEFYGAAAGGDPYLFPSGSDANRGFKYLTKGSGAHQFQTGSSFVNTQFVVAHTASAVNYLQVTGAASGGAPALSAQGSDTDVSLYLSGKGAGTLQFGTYTAGVLIPAGYITIKDAGGTTRRLLVG